MTLFSSGQRYKQGCQPLFSTSSRQLGVERVSLREPLSSVSVFPHLDNTHCHLCQVFTTDLCFFSRLEPLTLDSAAYPFLAFSGIPSVSFRFTSDELVSDAAVVDAIKLGPCGCTVFGFPLSGLPVLWDDAGQSGEAEHGDG